MFEKASSWLLLGIAVLCHFDWFPRASSCVRGHCIGILPVPQGTRTNFTNSLLTANSQVVYLVNGGNEEEAPRESNLE
ncbi:hypothetical protein E2C01_079961 [Portunus trituberculatus]|uniref:Secreted protein n=1 Tax=Portunus trituberculatus TaxID=210409 RepID=A0A5B7IWZ8_PORTR|nr:hypothetical protein [Portunus trituberculatus]